MRAGARDARAPGLLGLGGVPLLRVPSHDSEPTEEGWGPLAGLGPVPEHRGKDDAVALGLSACGQCRSPDCPLLTQVQGQPGKRRWEDRGRAGAPTASGWGWRSQHPHLPSGAGEADGFAVQREPRPRGAAGCPRGAGHGGPWEQRQGARTLKSRRAHTPRAFNPSGPLGCHRPRVGGRDTIIPWAQGRRL